MHSQPRLCACCQSNIRLSYHPYCRECKAEYAREHPQPYKPHPLPKKSWEQCFWTKVRKTDGCWFWIGSVNRRGYANFRIGKGTIDPGRFLYEQLNGVIPKGLVLYRTCRIHSCVNPAHLAVATRDKLPKDDPEEKFWGRVNKNGPLPINQPELGVCWVWTARINPYGYGQFFFNGRDEGAHRVAWQLANGIGSIPDDKWVCHKCDNRACVRLDHLFLDTPEGDVWDMVMKNRDRHPKGEDAGKSKLTEEQVRLIRYLYNPENRQLSKIARIFNVTSECVHAIVNRRTWKHI